jgi:hypothetical protein
MTDTIEALRLVVNAAEKVTDPLITLSVAVDGCDVAAVDAIAGRLNPATPGDCPLLLELRTARRKLATLGTAVEMLEQSIAIRRRAIYFAGLEAK